MAGDDDDRVKYSVALLALTLSLKFVFPKIEQYSTPRHAAFMSSGT
jgi:hypothetical protein